MTGEGEILQYIPSMDSVSRRLDVAQSARKSCLWRRDIIKILVKRRGGIEISPALKEVQQDTSELVRRLEQRRVKEGAL